MIEDVYLKYLILDIFYVNLKCFFNMVILCVTLTFRFKVGHELNRFGTTTV